MLSKKVAPMVNLKGMVRIRVVGVGKMASLTHHVSIMGKSSIVLISVGKVL